MGFNYGLTDNDFEAVKKKLSKQKNYMENHSFINEHGEVKTLLDLSYSANLSTRYYPRILNKVNTFVSLGINKDLTPVFLTMTLDGFFRDMLRGDYTRLTPKMIDKYLLHIPNNDRNGKYWDYIRNGAYSDLRTKKAYGTPLTPRDLYKILSHQMHRFSRSKTLQDIRQKHNEDYMMIRVTEPHKDGVPHFHVLMYLPERFIPAVYNHFHNFFPAPRNAKKINYKEDGRHPTEIYPGYYETKGFQVELRSPAGYILKYILKSFRNLIEGKDLDYLQAWYIHNKIPRIITTHSLISQDVYHHAALLDDDWYYLTNLKLDHHYERDTLFNTFRIADDKRELIYENGYYKLVSNGRTVKEFGENRIYKMKFTEKRPYYVFPKYRRYLDCSFHRVNLSGWRFIPKYKYRYKINMKPEFIDIELPDGTFMIYDKNSGKYGRPREFKHIYSYNPYILLPGHAPKNAISDLDLFDWFYNFDFDRENMKLFGMIKRTMVERGLLELEEVDLSEFNTDFEIKDFDLVAGGGFEPPTSGL